MNEDWSRLDVEGVLVLQKGAASRPVKRLALDVAWCILDPKDLEYLLPAWVEKVDVDHGAGVMELQYVAGQEPLDAPTLREAIAPSRGGWGWRLAVILLHLARDLAAFHNADVVQGVVHPERVVRRTAGFGLLPTLTGTLAPLSRIPGNEVAGWLHYVAPEVLRTRFNDVALLMRGDVYSLGRLAVNVSSRHFEPDVTSSTLAFVNRRIEGRSPPEIGHGSESSTTSLAIRMCAHDPEGRPDLADVITQLECIVRDTSPGAAARGLLEKRGAEEAELYLADVLGVPLHPALDLSLVERYRLEADIAMAKDPRDIVRAIDRIDKATREDPDCWPLFGRLGALYLQHIEHPQRIALAAACYERAAKISGWDPEITDIWAELLGTATSPAEALEELNALPWDSRTPHVHATRLRSLVGVGEARVAWQEAERWVGNCEEAPLMEAVLLEIVARLEPLWVKTWMTESQPVPLLMGAVIESVLR